MSQIQIPDYKILIIAILSKVQSQNEPKIMIIRIIVRFLDHAHSLCNILCNICLDYTINKSCLGIFEYCQNVDMMCCLPCSSYKFIHL